MEHLLRITDKINGFADSFSTSSVYIHLDNFKGGGQMPPLPHPPTPLNETLTIYIMETVHPGDCN